MFYIVVAVAGLSLDDLRKHGWLFDLGDGASQEAWYKMYSYLGLHTPFYLGFGDADLFSRFQCGALGCHLGHFAYAICFASVFLAHGGQVYAD